MRYTAEFFRENYPEWKRRKDWPPTRYFYRPISFYVSSIFANMGWTANMVSYLSAVIGLIACAGFMFTQPILGAILVNVWLVFDCADGNIARAIKKERYGDFADSMSSYLCVGFLFVCIGYCVNKTGGQLVSAGNPIIILIGALAGSSDSLMRLLYQKYLNSSYEQGLKVEHVQDPSSTSGVNRLRMKVDGYLSLGGILPIALIVGTMSKSLDIVVLLWCCYYMITLVSSTIYLVLKTFKANKDTDSVEDNNNDKR